MTLVTTDSGGTSGQIHTMAHGTIQTAVAMEGCQGFVHPGRAASMPGHGPVAIMATAGAVSVRSVEIVAGVADRFVGCQGVMRYRAVGPA